MVERTVQRDGERLLERSADFTAYSLLQQWDEEFFIRPGPAPDLFGYVVGASESWAAVRGNGAVLHARGLFEGELTAEALDEPRIVSDSGGTAFRVLAKPLLLWVNDGLMAVFFLLVALELKRELLDGYLSDRSALTLPLAGAVAGALVLRQS